MALVVGALIVNSGRILAAQRAYPPEFAGQWELPGGKVEPGEDPVTALQRELQEELQADVVVSQEVVSPDGAPWPILNGHRMRVWVCEARSEPQLGPDHLALRWLEPAEAFTVPWLAPDIPIIEEYFAGRS
ncbi:8-oxo-dGTP diphosphatase [Ruaniaceae bacterium KH17]|nr:8-oxo-dGTP diphosphatase [Ruaniaceae bacterium KH17]